MPQGILPFTIVTTESPASMTSHAGLPLVLETMRALELDKAIAEHLRLRQRNAGYSEAEKVESIVLLIAAGGDCVEDIRWLHADAGLERLLGRGLPSSDALLTFLYAFHDEGLLQRARDARAPKVVAFIPAENDALQGLSRVNVALVHAVAAHKRVTRATLDHDATIQESHKKQAMPHYKGGRGYQPVAVYWNELDVVVGDEYRDGNVPAGMSNLPLIQRSFAALPSSVESFFFRADSACYDTPVLQWLANPERTSGPRGAIGFTISADMTEPLRRLCEQVPEGDWRAVEDRGDETVHCADVEFTPGDWPKAAEPLRYVAMRIRKKQGHLFASGGDTKYLAVVSNRRELGGAELLRWHWQKAGSIEAVHDVTKNELAAAVPPCGRFGANAAWYRLSLMTYNVLSAMKSLALPAEMGTARPKRLRFSIFAIAGRIVSHAGQLLLRIGEGVERLADLIGARSRLAALTPRASSA